mmetsp:Transcript_707/g.1229  ORF Transcript_707/g.1229 Transcript_707/m.1229 type:complete len:241 (+) Transcript_707:86-808(+)
MASSRPALDPLLVLLNLNSFTSLAFGAISTCPKRAELVLLVLRCSPGSFTRALGFGLSSAGISTSFVLFSFLGVGGSPRRRFSSFLMRSRSASSSATFFLWSRNCLPESCLVVFVRLLFLLRLLGWEAGVGGSRPSSPPVSLSPTGTPSIQPTSSSISRLMASLTPCIPEFFPPLVDLLGSLRLFLSVFLCCFALTFLRFISSMAAAILSVLAGARLFTYRSKLQSKAVLHLSLSSFLGQ